MIHMFIKRNAFLRKPYLLIPQSVRNFGKKVLKKYSNPEELIQFTDQEKNAIHDRLFDDMKQFHDVYGFNVKKWGFNIG